MGSPFKALVRQLFDRTRQTDAALQGLQLTAQAIRKRHIPRNSFNRWKQSQAGQNWRATQYHAQQGRCAICAGAIGFKGSHIDHIQPLKTHPKLAIAPSNLQLTCPDCNLSKGAR
jgi:5-methylcytosine-specific restriction endonuclease McrA